MNNILSHDCVPPLRRFSFELCACVVYFVFVLFKTSLIRVSFCQVCVFVDELTRVELAFVGLREFVFSFFLGWGKRLQASVRDEDFEKLITRRTDVLRRRRDPELVNVFLKVSFPPLSAARNMYMDQVPSLSPPTFFPAAAHVDLHA